MILTLKSLKKQHKENIKLQKLQFEKEMEITVSNHNKLNKINEERSRIAIMPYFKLIDDIQITRQNDSLVFPLVIKNVGSGTAVEVRIVFDKHKHNSNDYPFISNGPDIIRLYYYSNYLFDNIVQENDKTPFEFILGIKDIKTGRDINYLEEMDNEKTLYYLLDEVSFSIRFRDVKQNLYEQSFWFQYGLKLYPDKAIRVETYPPKLISLDNSQD